MTVKMNETQVAEALSLYEQGAALRALGLKYGVTGGCLAARFKNRNVN